MEDLFLSRMDKEQIICSGIPFGVERDRQNILPLSQSEYDFKAPVAASFLYLLGLTTKFAECSEWWGAEEYCFDQSKRLYIGDILGYLHIIYEGDKMEVIPFIYGVTVWSYELVEKVKPYENNLKTFDGPYGEPFASDSYARELLDNSLQINSVTGGDKGSRYILAIKLDTKHRVKKIRFLDSPKRNGVFVTSYTFLKKGNENHLSKSVDYRYFIKKDYLDSADLLARRLYQFRDEIPVTVEEISNPENATELRFSGSSAAAIFTNVYRKNILDMSQDKIDSEGVPHTSSSVTANFGLYVGNGTYRIGKGSYYDHCWSRDVGRTATEVAIFTDCKNIRNYADYVLKYLYDPLAKYYPARWKRIVNVRQLGWKNADRFDGKENDGHASIMLSLYQAYRCGAIDADYIRENIDKFSDSLHWITWQIQNSAQSFFDGVLWGETEASCQWGSFPDLFSNVMTVFALLGYEILFSETGFSELSEESRALRQLLEKGINSVFVTDSEKYGELYQDCLYDVWTYAYKRFAYAFVMCDVLSYDLEILGNRKEKCLRNTYREQKARFFNPYSARQMGYGQGYLTLTAFMLDEVEDYSACFEACAYLCYNSHECNYIVPEGVIVHPSGDFWFRNADLGNAVQQGEIVKVSRLVVGLDDLSREKGLKILSRLPLNMKSIEAKGYCLHLPCGHISCDYSYSRVDNGYELRFSAERKIPLDFVRVGPFAADVNCFEITGCPKNFIEKMIAGKKYLIFYFSENVKNLHIKINIKKEKS